MGPMQAAVALLEIEARRPMSGEAYLGWMGDRDRASTAFQEAINLASGAAYVDPADAYTDADGTRWNTIGGRGNAGGQAGRPGSDRAGFADESEHQAAVDECRVLAEINEFAVNGHENRASYICGKGHQYKLVAKKGEKVEEKRLAEMQTAFDSILEANNWCERQPETVLRTDRDGEAFIRKFKTNGVLKMRFVEPWQIISPPGANDNTQFGIECEPGDAETPRVYFIDGEPVPADEIQHRKANVVMGVRRGIPLFYPVRSNLRRAKKMLACMAARIEIVTSVALIRKHKSAAPASVAGMRSGLAALTATNPITGALDYIQQYKPGTILDTSANTEYEVPDMGVGLDQFVQGLQAELRSICSRLVMPEFMLTSDASNGNYASTMVAEGPSVRMFERAQEFHSRHDKALLEEALRYAAESGLVDAALMELVEIQVVLPPLVTRDAKLEAEKDKILAEAGILSPQTWSMRNDLDYDQEQANIEAHKAAGRIGMQADPNAAPLGPDGKPLPGATLGAMRGAVEPAATKESLYDVIAGRYEAFCEGVGFDPALHPRHDSGSSQGGEFAPKGGGADAKKKLTDSAEFRAWFGDSKVVDEGGEPLVVYHGTTKDFNQFGSTGTRSTYDAGYSGRGYYFGSSDTASTYAGTGPLAKGPAPGGANVKPVYLSMQNPLVIQEVKGGDDQIVAVAKALGINLPQEVNGINAKRLVPTISDDITKALKGRGHDGVIYRWSGGREIEYMVPDSTQIKSATGNRGTFDPKNPDIRESRESEPGALGESFPDHEGRPGQVGGSLPRGEGGGKSKIVNPDGTDRIVYHGTESDFTEFDDAKLGALDWGLHGRGHYFATSKEIASQYVKGSGRIVQSYLDIKNPLELHKLKPIEADKWLKLFKSDPIAGREKLIAAGYDGVISSDPDKNRFAEIVALHAKQIRKAGDDISIPK